MDRRDNGVATEGRTETAPEWIAEVVVEPKPGVNDPQGDAIFGGLHSLGYSGVAGVRSGRFFRVRLTAADAAAARAAVASMCDRLLANPVIERYTITQIESAEPVAAGQTRGGTR